MYNIHVPCEYVYTYIHHVYELTIHAILVALERYLERSGCPGVYVAERSHSKLMVVLKGL